LPETSLAELVLRRFWMDPRQPSVRYLPAPRKGLRNCLRFGRASFSVVERVAQLCGVTARSHVLDVGSGDGSVCARC
jgi:cyclopropane fatty-acyl-phospholipid synthase-like methyltransferase